MKHRKDDLFFVGGSPSRSRHRWSDRKSQSDGFTCLHCHGFVSSDSLFSAVWNRNHCPYCLWSRHLDLFTPGDRLSACRSLMQPLGLTLKRTRKKYGPGRGELMLIHACRDCKHLSLNRLAADDDPQMVLAVFEDSLRLDKPALAGLEASNIRAFNAADRETVCLQLFGHPADLVEMLFKRGTRELV